MKHFLVDTRHSSSSPVLCLQTWVSLNDIPNLWFMIKISEDYAELFYTSESSVDLNIPRLIRSLNTDNWALSN